MEDKKSIKSQFSDNARKLIKEEFYNNCFLCKKYTIEGQCAHIVSMALTGPRSYMNYNQYSHLSPEVAKKIFDHWSNGLWACYECHKKIDKNPEEHTLEYLLSLKYGIYSQYSTYDDTHKNSYDVYKNIINNVIENIKINKDITEIDIKKINSFFNDNRYLVDMCDLANNFINEIYNTSYIYRHLSKTNLLNDIIYEFCLALGSNKILLNKYENAVWELIELVGNISSIHINKKNIDQNDLNNYCKLIKSYSYILAVADDKQTNNIKEVGYHILKTNNITDEFVKNYFDFIVKAGLLFKTNRYIDDLEKKFISENIKHENDIINIIDLSSLGCYNTVFNKKFKF